VSTIHGNFIVNKGGARAADVIALIDLVRGRVAAAVGEEPRLEVEIWRDPA
jgi:UDP-N-acetylmuramate dehydrogenase